MKVRKIFFVICITMIFLSSCSLNENFEKSYFGKERYKETEIACTAEDRQLVREILYTIEKAFSYDDKNKDCREKFGVLSRYCFCKEDYPDVVDENHSWNFVTAKTTGENGYIWIRYSQEGIDKEGETTTGSWDILSRIEIKKVKGEWEAKSIDEAP